MTCNCHVIYIHCCNYRVLLFTPVKEHRVSLGVMRTLNRMKSKDEAIYESGFKHDQSEGLIRYGLYDMRHFKSDLEGARGVIQNITKIPSETGDRCATLVPSTHILLLVLVLHAIEQIRQ